MSQVQPDSPLVLLLLDSPDFTGKGFYVVTGRFSMEGDVLESSVKRVKDGEIAAYQLLNMVEKHRSEGYYVAYVDRFSFTCHKTGIGSNEYVMLGVIIRYA